LIDYWIYDLSLKAASHRSVSTKTLTLCVKTDRIHLCHNPQSKDISSPTEKSMFA